MTSSEYDLQFQVSYGEDELYLIDEEYMDEYEPCQNGKYYLGSYKYFEDIGEYLLMSQISKHVFYASNCLSMPKFIFWYSGAYIPDPTLQIMQVFMKDECATAVLKTYWIRIIQRTWKRVYKERQDYIMKCKQLNYLRNRELNFTTLNGGNSYPALKGMLQKIRNI
jgi:hypothetical protein